MIALIAAHQLRMLRRERIFLAILASLLLMTVLAGFIGWSSHNTIVKVYEESSAMLVEEGKSPPPNPFDLKPRLALLSNMTIYIPLIGALLAIVIGHLAIVSDRESGSVRLIFSRPVSRATYLWGKLAGIGIALGVILATSFVLSIVSLTIVNSDPPTALEIGRLGLFFLLSLAYMVLFALVGVTTALIVQARSLSLLVALGIWMVITFMIPQFTSGLRPTASLNPVVDPVSTSQRFFEVTSHFRSISISELYRDASASILQTAPESSKAAGIDQLLPISVLLVALGILTAVLISRLDLSEQGTHD
ncbi:MAG TPA: ABC transporter permease subunit [Thermomicrobiales bacterium]|jgi:ABC-type transport system involved in multi-copper enzyme maturation permease subunit|nr:ABC transporter permease subunit [Thermomicrobiales bacterium]